MKSTEMHLIFLAFRNTLRRFYWLPIAIVLSNVLVLLWRIGNWDYVDLLEMAVISGSISILGVTIVVVPVECNRLKRIELGLHVSDS